MEEFMASPAAGVMYTNYADYKGALDGELQNTAESFVRIGYLLKLAKENPALLAGSGYANVNEFAQAEYNIDKTMVSRFMNINTRFSEGGFSDCLKEQYRGFGYAKLTLMLQLSDAVAEELSPEFSKTDVQAIKEEVEAEHAISDLEVMMEEKNEAQEQMESNLQKVLYQLGMENPEKYRDIHTAMKEPDRSRALNETLAPTGENIYSVRIPGTGRLMLSVKDMDRDVSLVNVRTGEKETYTWSELEAAAELIVNTDLSAEESYRVVYDTEFPKAVPVQKPEKPEIAPVQQKKAPKKQSKVTKAPKKPAAVVEEDSKEEDEEAIPIGIPMGTASLADILTGNIPKPTPEEIAEAEKAIKVVAEPAPVEIVGETAEARINAECETDSKESEAAFGEIDTEKVAETAEILNAESDSVQCDELEIQKKHFRGHWRDSQRCEDSVCVVIADTEERARQIITGHWEIANPEEIEVEEMLFKADGFCEVYYG